MNDEYGLAPLAVVLASGSGKRLGQPEQPKHLVNLHGVPIVAWTLNTLLESGRISGIVVVTQDQYLDETRQKIFSHLGDQSGRLFFAVGQPERMDSFLAGFTTLESEFQMDEKALVLLVDANRPLFSRLQLEKLILAGSKSGAACLARPVVNGIAEIAGSKIITVPEKERYFEFVTPEILRSQHVREALRSEEPLPRSLVEIALELNIQPEIVSSSNLNMKLTYPEDIAQLHSIRLPEGSSIPKNAFHVQE